jgi:hypothetical protein
MATDILLEGAPVLARKPQNLEREFCRVNDLAKPFGIRRGTAYNLLAAGKIKSVELRRRGCVRGVRLISVPSVREYLASLLKEQNKE